MIDLNEEHVHAFVPILEGNDTAGLVCTGCGFKIIEDMTRTVEVTPEGRTCGDIFYDENDLDWLQRLFGITSLDALKAVFSVLDQRLSNDEIQKVLNRRRDL
jgi:hypothetical protein